MCENENYDNCAVTSGLTMMMMLGSGNSRKRRPTDHWNDLAVRGLAPLSRHFESSQRLATFTKDMCGPLRFIKNLLIRHCSRAKMPVLLHARLFIDGAPLAVVTPSLQRSTAPQETAKLTRPDGKETERH